MRCIYLDKRDFLSEEDMRIHTACVCMNKESDKYKTFSIDKAYICGNCLHHTKERESNEFLYSRYAFWSQEYHPV